VSLGRLGPFDHVAALLAAIALLGFIPVASADTFDAPVKRKVVDMGPSSGNLPGQHFRVKLYCWFYPNFMVKEEDDFQRKYPSLVAIVPIRQAVAPSCSLAHAAGERAMKWPEWSGSFEGVKGDLVFSGDADGLDGGLTFVVYDYQTGQKIFEDSELLGTPNTASPFSRLRFKRAADGGLSLKYVRIVEADCDLHLEGAACWEEVRKKLGIESDRRPVCSGYEDISSRWVSAVAYPVEVSLFPQPTWKTIAGPVECWPVD